MSGSTQAAIELRPEVQRLAQALLAVGDAVGFDDAVLADTRAQLQRQSASDRLEASAHLAALGMKIERSGKPGVDLALGQLVLLVKDVVGSEEQARDIFRAAQARGGVELSAPTGSLPPAAEIDALWGGGGKR